MQADAGTWVLVVVPAPTLLYSPTQQTTAHPRSIITQAGQLLVRPTYSSTYSTVKQCRWDSRCRQLLQPSERSPHSHLQHAYTSRRCCTTTQAWHSLTTQHSMNAKEVKHMRQTTRILQACAGAIPCTSARLLAKLQSTVVLRADDGWLQTPQEICESLL